MILFRTRKHGATLAGVFSVALGSALLLCGAGPTPTGNVQNADVNANGFSLTNAATVSAASVYANSLAVTNGLTLPGTFVLSTAHGGTGTTTGTVAWEWKSSAFTAVAGHKYQIDTSSSAVTVTLPATAVAMDSIELADATLSWNTHNVTINRNGLNINNGTTNYTASVQGNRLSLIYISSGYGWSIK